MELDASNCLREDVGSHFLGANINQEDFALSDFLTNKVMLNIDVLGARMKFRVL